MKKRVGSGFIETWSVLRAFVGSQAECNIKLSKFLTKYPKQSTEYFDIVPLTGEETVRYNTDQENARTRKEIKDRKGAVQIRLSLDDTELVIFAGHKKLNKADKALFTLLSEAGYTLRTNKNGCTFVSTFVKGDYEK
jgi:hypothetical protein